MRNFPTMMAMAGLTGVFFSAALAAETEPTVAAPVVMTHPDANAPQLESGIVEIPFKPALSGGGEAQIHKILQILNIQLSEFRLDLKIRELVQARRKEIEAKDPAYFQQIDRHVKELTAEAGKAFAADGPAMQKKISTAFDQQMVKLKADLQKDSPAIEVSASYRYKAASRDPGSPGWANLKANVVEKGMPAEAGTVSLDQELNLLAATVPITIPIKLKATISLAASFGVMANNCVAQTCMPVSSVEVRPILSVKCALALTSDESEMLANNGQLTGVGCTFVEMLPRAAGTLKADPNTPKPIDAAAENK